MRIAGYLALPTGGDCVALSPGCLHIEGGRIVEIDLNPDAITTSCDLGGEHAIIMPGFVDAHVHLPQFDSIGVDGFELLEWLDKVIFPAEARWANATFAADQTDRALDQLIAHGTTSFAAYATVHFEATKAAIDRCAARNLRCAVGQSLMDQQSPTELMRPTKQLLDECRALDAHARSLQSRVEAAVTLRFAVCCSHELMKHAARFGREVGALVQTHLAETIPECRRACELHGAETYTEVYEAAGVLSPCTIVGHGIHLDDRERALLAASQSTIAHCPVANQFLRSGVMHRGDLHKASVALALGSDIGAGTQRSMVRNAVAAIDAAKSLGLVPPSAGQSFWQITGGNADRLGWTEVGRIARGAAADLLIVKPDIHWRSAIDPLGMLLHAWDDRWLQAVVIHGDVAWRGNHGAMHV